MTPGIASAAEINAKKAALASKSYEADISYLKNASSHYLSAKLMRMEAASEPSASPRTPISQEEVTKSTEKRRQARLEREQVDLEKKKSQLHGFLSNYQPVADSASIIRAEFEKSNSFLSPERTAVAKESANMRRINRLNRSSEPVEPSETAKFSRAPRRLQSEVPARPATSDDARQPRRRMSGPTSEARRPGRGGRNSNTNRQAKKPPPQRAQTKLAPQANDVNEKIFEGVYKPTFSGPSKAFSDPRGLFGGVFSAKDATIVTETGDRVSIPTSKVSAFKRGKYDSYIKAQPEDFTSPPEEIGPIKIAQRTLSHQRHYSLPAKIGTLNIITGAVPKAAASPLAP